MLRRQRTLLAVACVALMVSCGQQLPQATTQSYESMSIGTTDETLVSKYSASIRGKSDIAVYPQVSGYITDVCVDEGSVVKKGQPLFIIDQVTYQAAYETAKANVEVAKANVETARLVYESKLELYNSNVVSAFELSTAENALVSAEAQLQLAVSQETNAANNLSYTIVKSPSDGVLGMFPFKVGALVGPSLPAPLTTVSDNSEMYVYFSLTENQLLSLVREYDSVGAAIDAMPSVKLELSDGSEYGDEGRIETISGMIDKVTGAISVRAIFPNKGMLLRSGGSGKVVIPRVKSNAIVIPKSATFELQDQVFVFKVVDGKAQSTKIAVNQISRSGEYIVESGLSVGDVIITEGVGFMRDGMAVNIK